MDRPKQRCVVDPRVVLQFREYDPSATRFLHELFATDSQGATRLEPVCDDGEQITALYREYLRTAVTNNSHEDPIANAILGFLRAPVRVPTGNIPTEFMILGTEANPYQEFNIDKLLIRVAEANEDIIVIISDQKDCIGFFSSARRRSELAQYMGRAQFFSISEYFHRPMIYLEGKTDWKYLKAALRSLQSDGKYADLLIEFEGEFNSISRGYDRLHKLLSALGEDPNPSSRISVFIFDRDVPGGTIKETISDPTNVPGEFRRWKQGLYSFLLPVPNHRHEQADDICIEFFFQDSDLFRQNHEGRRLFLGIEFSKDKPWRHKDNPQITLTERNLAGQYKIIADSVFCHSTHPDNNAGSIALSKEDFATSIVNQIPPFDGVDFSEFASIFDVIEVIMDQARRAL